MLMNFLMIEYHMILNNKEYKHEENLMLWPNMFSRSYFGKENGDSSHDEVTFSYKHLDNNVMKSKWIDRRGVHFEKIHWSKPLKDDS